MHFPYVALGECGLVKVGITTKPKARAKLLSRQFKKLGSRLVRVKFCIPIPFAFGIEGTLCRKYKANRVEGREWFRGVDFETVYSDFQSKSLLVRPFQMPHLRRASVVPAKQEA
jgi:hypothetical protein